MNFKSKHRNHENYKHIDQDSEINLINARVFNNKRRKNKLKKQFKNINIKDKLGYKSNRYKIDKFKNKLKKHQIIRNKFKKRSQNRLISFFQLI